MLISMFWKVAKGAAQAPIGALSQSFANKSTGLVTELKWCQAQREVRGETEPCAHEADEIFFVAESNVMSWTPFTLFLLLMKAGKPSKPWKKYVSATGAGGYS
jgi:hypothetical protein